MLQRLKAAIIIGGRYHFLLRSLDGDAVEKYKNVDHHKMSEVSYLDGITVEDVVEMKADNLSTAFSTLLAEGLIEEEFDPAPDGVTGDALLEQQESFRSYLIDLVKSHREDSDSEGGSEVGDEFDFGNGPPEPEFIPEEKCRSDFGDDYKGCGSGMYCNVETNMCYPKDKLPMTLDIGGMKVGGTKEQLGAWSIRLDEHRKSLIKRKEKGDLVVVPPGPIPARVLFTKEFRDKVATVMTISGLKALAKQAEVAQYNKKSVNSAMFADLEGLRTLVLAKVDAALLPPKDAEKIRCGLDVPNAAAFKGCPAPKICDVDTGDCLDALPARVDSMSAVVNGLNVFGSSKAVQAFVDKMNGKASEPVVPIVPLVPSEPVIVIEDEDDPEYNGYKLSQVTGNLTLVKLKDIATAVGVTKSGNKADVLERIRKAIKSNAKPPAKAPSPKKVPTPKKVSPAKVPTPKKVSPAKVPTPKKVPTPAKVPVGEPEYKGVKLADVTEKKTVNDLKKMAEMVGVTKTGRKDEIIARIRKLILSQVEPVQPPKPPGPPQPPVQPPGPPQPPVQPPGPPKQPDEPEVIIDLDDKPKPPAGGEMSYLGVALSDVTEKLTAVRLKEIAGVMGLTKSGTKDVLIDRIRAAIKTKGSKVDAEPVKPPPAKLPTPQKKPSPQKKPDVEPPVVEPPPPDVEPPADEDKPKKPTIASVKKLGGGDADKSKLDKIQERLRKCAGLIA